MCAFHQFYVINNYGRGWEGLLWIWTRVEARSATSQPSLLSQSLSRCCLGPPLLPPMLMPQTRETASSTHLHGPVLTPRREDADATEALKQRALFLASAPCRHDNLVRLVGVTLDGTVGVQSFVFELADEGSIDKHIHRLVTPPGGR